jgi:hypothetical protein
MESLPPELMARIFSIVAVKEKKLTPYAKISRAWQRTVEQHTFSHLSFSSDELDRFNFTVIGSPYIHRRTAIRRVDFGVRLPDYNHNACGRFERQADRQINDKAFGKALADLFTLLQAIDAGDGCRPIDLHLLHFYSALDINCRDEETLRAQKMAKASGKRQDLFELRCRDSYLHLFQPESLPLLYNVTSLTINGNTARKLAPAVAPGLMSRLPNLVSTNCSFSDMERKRPNRRTRLRSEFSKQLISIGTPNCLQKFVFELRHMNPANENFLNADVRGVVQSPYVDDLSTALRKYSQAAPGLSIFKLSGPICVGPEIFQSSGADEEDGHKQQQWQELKVVTVELSAVRPDGGWYTELDPNRGSDSSEEEQDEDEDGEDAGSEDLGDVIHDGMNSQGSSSGYDSGDSFFAMDELPPDSYGHDDEKRDLRLNGQEPSAYFRTKPTPELEALFTSAAHAAARVPSLRNMRVSLQINPSGRTGRKKQNIGFLYLAAGVKGARDVGKERDCKRLLWDAPKGWRMSGQLQEQWMSVLGDDGIVKYKEW